MARITVLEPLPCPYDLGGLPGCRDVAGQSTVFRHERGTLRLRGFPDEHFTPSHSEFVLSCLESRHWIC